MKINILGISAFYHDSAACLVCDGKIVSAAQEERFTRKKHDDGYPENAIAYCLEEGGVTQGDLDYIVYYEKPLLTFDRIIETYLAFVPRGFRSFSYSLPLWIKQKVNIRRILSNNLVEASRAHVLFALHHQSHAASAYYPSPFDEAAILTIDGVGEWTTTALSVGKGNSIRLIKEMRFPHSLGLLYSAFTHYLGFRVNSGEYKVMGLAPYGEPKYVETIFKNIVDLKEDGSFQLDMSYFDYCIGLQMTNKRFWDLFQGEARHADSEITQRHMDIAASIQVVTERIVVKMAQYAREITGMKNICLAGGCALNCVANGVIERSNIFDNMYVQPASGDAGGALGAALLCWHGYLGQPRSADAKDMMRGSYLGPSWSVNSIRGYLERHGYVYHAVPRGDVPKRVAGMINDQKVVGIFQGRMEYGPRALGSRSIVGDARNKRMQMIMNQKIKFRESFRPFAPSVLEEYASDYFEGCRESPYMLMVYPVSGSQRVDVSSNESGMSGFGKLKLPRSSVPAITHVDYSARVQTVTKERNGFYYDIIRSFYDMTGCPVIINTSFNIRGEPIVCTVDDACRCFMSTNIDVLVLENFILIKDEQTKDVSDEAIDEYRHAFKRFDEVR